MCSNRHIQGAPGLSRLGTPSGRSSTPQFAYFQYRSTFSSSMSTSMYISPSLLHDYIAAAKPSVPTQPSFGIDSPLRPLVASFALSLLCVHKPPTPLPQKPPTFQLYATLEGKHDLWSSLLPCLPFAAFAHPILDFGCGRGPVLLKTTAHKRSLGHTNTSYGIDIFRTGDQSGNAPEATWQNVAAAGFTSQIILHAASFTQSLQFKNGVFGVVTSSLVAHNFDNDGRRAVRETARVCAPGGYVGRYEGVGMDGGHCGKEVGVNRIQIYPSLARYVRYIVPKKTTFIVLLYLTQQLLT
ncbi:Methyltransferase [Mycena venus]|uniref:Methyltransferase n=1 Tax=Mycena venus TaxID=2733690 RepID=A0A8H6XV07_9AGAR|nr:Methyltransferase [Mycena venus]